MFAFHGSADQILDVIGDTPETLFAIFVYSRHYDRNALVDLDWG